MRAVLITVAAVALATAACNRKNPPNLFPSTQPAPGTFELCILANPDDDEIGIKDAEAFFEKAKSDDKLKRLLKDCASTGKPPPPPVIEGEPYIALERECSYRWAKLSAETVVRDQILPGADARRKLLYDNLKQAREKGDIFVDTFHTLDTRNSQVYWSQERPTSNPGADSVDYFLLVRVESPENAILAQEVTISVEPGTTDPESRMLSGRLNETGTRKFASLTSRNQPAQRIQRSLAILVRGEVISTANLNSSVTEGRFVIEMGSDPNEADRIFEAIRGQ